MATTSSNQGLPLPTATDPNNPPTMLAAYANAIETRVAQRYSSQAARDAVITGAALNIDGQLVYEPTTGLDYVTFGGLIRAQGWTQPGVGSVTSKLSAANTPTGGIVQAISATTYANLPSSVAVTITGIPTAVAGFTSIDFEIEHGALMRAGSGAVTGSTQLSWLAQSASLATMTSPGGSTNTITVSHSGLASWSAMQTARHVTYVSYSLASLGGSLTVTLQAQAAAALTLANTNYASLKVTALRFR